MASNSSLQNETDLLVLDFANFVTPWNERVSCAILFSVINICGVFSNGIALGLSIFTPLCHKKVNLFIANLAISDFMCTGLFLLTQNFYILYREILPASGCQWIAFAHFIAAMQAFFSPPLLALNRYICLFHNHVYDEIYTGVKIFLMILGCWVLCTGIPLVFTLTDHTGYDIRNEHCCILVEGSTIWTIAYWLVIIVPLLGVCDSIMVYCNWKIYKKLKEHVKDHSSLLQKNIVNENKEILYFLIIDMLTPISVISIYHISKFAFPNRFSLASRQFFTFIYMSNAALRGLIILILLRPYRDAFKHYILRVNNAIRPAPFGSPQKY